MRLPTEDEPCVVVEGDCLSFLPHLRAAGVAAVVSDPPYGMDWDTDSTRFTGGKGYHDKRSSRVHGDAAPFDPAPWLEFPRATLWGYHHFANRLPVGSVLVWLKKSDTKLGAFLSDAELAWEKGGHGVYAKRIIWDGCAREVENGQHYHPTQKPVNLMRWCIRRLKLPPGALILDPYAGSGTTGVAALKEGVRALLIEADPAHAATARRRVTDAMGTGLLAGLA